MCDKGNDWTNRASSYDFYFKDIKLENLDDIVESPDILEVGADAAQCWNEGDDVLITSSGKKMMIFQLGL